MSLFKNRLLRLTAFLSMLAIFSACSTIPADKPDEESQVITETETVEPQVKVEQPLVLEQPEPRQLPPRPEIDLTEDILFKVLVAEVAGQRGEINIAVENYMELARETRDPVVIERATRIAVYARDDAAAFEAAKLWAEIDPENTDAQQVLAVMSLRKGNMEKAQFHLEKILARSQGNMDQKLWMIANFLGREEDQPAVIELMERLMANHMSDADALYAYAHVAARLGDTEKSRSLLEQVLIIKPGNEAAVMTYLSLLQRSGETNEAITWLEEALKNTEDDFNLRMAYARLLTDSKRFDDARRQFEILLVQAPNNIDVIYALGLLYLQNNRLEQAEEKFLRLTELKKKTFDANYYLGRIAEERNTFEEASDYYQGVHGGENYLDARIRLSLILAKQGEVEKALTNIRSIQQVSNTEQLILIQAEGEILLAEKRYDEAMQLFDKSIADNPHPDLLYSRAMLAEKMSRLDILEADLKQILDKDPDNATALNALGYTLADRTERFEEAYDYIKRAHELSPDDFYILDSMGWVLYRLGRLDEAVDYLRQALALRNDPEIAAHLGEVLWVMGDKSAAKEVWDTALQATPQDDRLLKVIERFLP
ncbi:MAG: tetratricopeptide repeat protein [Pseudomonadota bacterium]